MKLSRQTKGFILLSRARSPQKLLANLGIDESLLYVATKGRSYIVFRNKKPWWERSADFHWKILELAKQKFREQILKFHPDRPDGCQEKACELIATWRRIEKLYRKRGYELER